MSFWDRYLAPGDVRQQRLRQEQQQGEAAKVEAVLPIQAPTKPARINAAHRRRRQNALVIGGAIFTCFSLVITRRAMYRRQVSVYPRQFTPSNAAGPKANGGLDAAAALGLASLNVFSVAMMSSGLFMSWFDIADVEDLRDQVRKAVGFDVYGGDSAADQEMEAWVADILTRKDDVGGLREGVLSKLAELDQMGKEKQKEVTPIEPAK